MLNVFSHADDLPRENMRVVFIHPDEPKGRPFWGAVTRVMQAAANDLDIELQVHHAKANRFISSKLAQRAAQQEKPPHYIVHIHQSGQSKKIFETAERFDIKAFTFNTGVPAEEKHVLGTPRERFKSWIGEIKPDDVDIGYQLGDFLIRAAKAKRLQGKDQKIHLIGFSGSRDSTAALERNEGLSKAVKLHGDVVLHQLIFTGWYLDDSGSKVKTLFNRYPETSVIWAASDVMALSASKGAKNYGRNLGNDVLVGGIDGIPQALNSIKSSDMLATVAGHFMEGAWALVLLFDHYHGKDFANEQVSFSSRSVLVNINNIGQYENLFDPVHVENIDFRRYSKVLNPSIKSYDFNLDSLLTSKNIPKNK